MNVNNMYAKVKNVKWFHHIRYHRALTYMTYYLLYTRICIHHTSYTLKTCLCWVGWLSCL